MIKTEDLSNEDLAAINGLLVQLMPKAEKVDRDCLKLIIGQNNIRICIIRDRESGKIVGMATIFFEKILTKTMAYVHNVVVDKNYRRKGVGKRLMEGVIDWTKENKVDLIELTSNPSRTAARELYKKLGFKKRDTTVFVLKLR